MVTKRDNFLTVKSIVEFVEANHPYEMKVDSYEDLKAFLDKEVELLDASHAKAQAKRAAKKGEDTVTPWVVNVLKSATAPVTADAIVDAIGIEDVTRAKVVNRLGKLVASNVVVKSTTKFDDGRTVTMYALA